MPKDTMEKKWNKLLKANWDLAINNYGAKFKLPHNNQIISNKNPAKGGVEYIYEYVNSTTAEPKYEVIKPNNFARFFDDTRCDFNELVADFIVVRKHIITEESKKSNTNSTISRIIESKINQGKQYREKYYNFFTTADCGTKYTQADDDFLYSKLYRDNDNNLYMKLNGEICRLEIKPNTERELLGNRIDINTQFWPAFFKENIANFEKWNNIVSDCIQQYCWDDKAQESIEKVILKAGVPRSYLECHALKIVEEGTVSENKTIWYFSGANMVINTASQDKSFSMNNLVKVFSQNLLGSVDVTRLKTLKLFSNDKSDDAISYIEMPIPNALTSEPTLPPTWDLFFGNGRFISPIMDKMKIACFVTNSLNANYDGRQVLVTGGQGHDGKGVFLNVLETIIGKENSCNLAVNAFSKEDEFGLMSAVNKKFIYLSDCKEVTNLFKQDKFKALSGGDSLDINRKYMTSIKYTPAGVTIAIATNNCFFLNDDHGRTRCVPLIFNKNYEENQLISRNKMIQDLLSEKKEFLQWCVDYRAFINKKYDSRLLTDSQLVCCADEDLDALVKGELTNREAYMRMIENMKLGKNQFCSLDNYSENDKIDNELLTNIVKDEFIKILDSFNNEQKEEFYKNYIIEKNDIEYVRLHDVFQLINQSLLLNKNGDGAFVSAINSVAGPGAVVLGVSSKSNTSIAYRVMQAFKHNPHYCYEKKIKKTNNKVKKEHPHCVKFDMFNTRKTNKQIKQNKVEDTIESIFG